MIKWLTIVLALVGASIGVWTVATARYLPPNPAPAMPPSVNPYANAIAATGIVEAASGDIEIAPPEPGLVVKVYAHVGDPVKAGDLLFDLDARTLVAEKLTASAAHQQALAELTRLRAQPRPEEVAPLREAVATAQVKVDDAKDQLARREIAWKASAATEGEMARLRFAVAAAETAHAEARAQLKRVEAGAWSHDIDVAQAAVEQAQARIAAIELQIERRSVRSPIAGVILKNMIEEGEYTGAVLAATGEPSMIIGDISSLRVRAQVDELDIPRLRKDASAVAIVRGYGDKPMALTMLRIEPLAQPKRQIAGSNIERVDTRVLDVLFQLDPAHTQSLYPGQLIDVFIDAPQ